LVQQGYSPSEVTILTPYVGQVFTIRHLIRYLPLVNGIRVCPVDNFQGEENEIILLSLVRSNDRKQIGFLKDENRICVAMSRAKQGFYAIGDFKMLTNYSERWSKIVARAKTMGIYGPFLRLSCQNHPNEAQIDARSAADFNNAPEGGCMRQCSYRLKCGHACDRVCHPYDRDHVEYQCLKPCLKTLCHLGHKCQQQCYRPCGQCMQVLGKHFDIRCHPIVARNVAILLFCDVHHAVNRGSFKCVGSC
jgi:AAA domain